MSQLADRINADLKDAMRARDSQRVTVLRSLKSALTNAAIEKGGPHAELSDADVTSVVRKQMKQRVDSRDQYRDAGRDDLASGEEAEIGILEDYLPAALSDEEITALVDEAIAETGATSRADMGAVMKVVQQRADGRADGKTLSQHVAQRLS